MSTSTSRRGEFVGVVGESGCGKSTLLFAIAQLLSPPAAITGGSVVFKGTDLVTMTATAARRRPVARHLRRHAERDERAEPGQAARRAVRGRDAGARREVGATIRQRSVEVLELVGIDAEHLKQLPAPAQRRHAAARHDRHGAAVHAGPGDHGRADLGARRRRAAFADGADQGAPAAAGVRRHLRHPRHVAGQPLLRPAGRDVRGPGRRDRADPRGLRHARRTRTARGCSTRSRRSAARACR